MDKELFAALVRRWALCGLLLLLGLALRAHGQNAGVVGIATKEITVFNAQRITASSGGIWQCNGSTTPIQCPVLPDIGAAANYLTYCNTNFVGTIDLEWSPTGINGTFLVLTFSTFGTADSACHQLQLGGYFPNLRSTVTATNGSLSAWYTSSAAPVAFFASAFGSNGATSPISCDLGNSVSQATAGTGLLASPINATDVVVICGMTVSFNGATSAGNIGIFWSASNACTSLSSSATWLIYTTSGTPQAIPVPIQQRNPNSIVVHGDAGLRNYPCVVNNSGATVEVSISYASVHGL